MRRLDSDSEDDSGLGLDVCCHACLSADVLDAIFLCFCRSSAGEDFHDDTCLHRHRMCGSTDVIGGVDVGLDGVSVMEGD